jgi:hypothetical protein
MIRSRFYYHFFHRVATFEVTLHNNIISLPVGVIPCIMLESNLEKTNNIRVLTENSPSSQ